MYYLSEGLEENDDVCCQHVLLGEAPLQLCALSVLLPGDYGWH
jgi:hypothetical protein